jgi:sugar transferase (PEP-CTERM/EpsH1 system associated)
MRGFDPELVGAAHLEDRIVQVGEPSEGFQFPLPRLVRAMRDARPHIVHTRNWGALEAILAARIAGVPVTIHSEHGYDLKMLNGIPFRQRLVRKTLYSMTDALFTVSSELREFHARQAGISRGRIQVLYNGVDTGKYKPRNELRAAILAELGIPAQSVVVGSVGRMVAIKDYPFTLRVVSELLQRGHDMHLLLVGAGPELPSLQDLVRNSAILQGRVHFCGFSNEISRFLNAMDIFVQASRAEGMSNTLLEAMASGLPLVAARVGGNPEVVSEGETGFLFALGDEAAMFGCIDRLASDPELRRGMGETSRQRALQRFSLERMLNEYRKLYQRLAAGRGIVAAREG